MNTGCKYYRQGPGSGSSTCWEGPIWCWFWIYIFANFSETEPGTVWAGWDLGASCLSLAFYRSGDRNTPTTVCSKIQITRELTLGCAWERVPRVTQLESWFSVQFPFPHYISYVILSWRQINNLFRIVTENHVSSQCWHLEEEEISFPVNFLDPDHF